MMRDTDRIFQMADGISDYVHTIDKMHRKQREIASHQFRTCGNCEYWMKKECVPEKQYGSFKSCNDIACDLFVRTPQAVRDGERAEQELVSIRTAASIQAERTGG